MIILALYNAKGGVGKTATSVNLAYISAESGLKTLLWDLDPQAAATYYYRLKPKIKGGAKKMIGSTDRFFQALKASEYQGLDVLPADFSIRHADLILGDMKKSHKQLKRLLKECTAWYDVIIIDSPPGLSLLAENVLRAATAVLVPLIPTTLSMRSFSLIDTYCKNEGISVERLFPFFSLVDRRKREHRETIDSAKTDDDRFLKSSIPYLSDIEKMGVKQAPLLTFAPRSRAAKAYQELWKEIRDRTETRAWQPGVL